MNASYTSCSSLHGGIDQYDRDSTITNFKSGKIKILVATSVAARGLDVKELVVVINYDCPNHYEVRKNTFLNTLKSSHQNSFT